MPRKKTQTTGKKPTAELASTVEKHSQGKTTARPAGKKKAVAKKAAPKPKYTRTHALRDALAKGGTREEITRYLDKLYQDNGGSPNPSGASAMVSLHVPVPKHFGVIEEDADGRLSLK